MHFRFCKLEPNPKKSNEIGTSDDHSALVFVENRFCTLTGIVIVCHEDNIAYFPVRDAPCQSNTGHLPSTKVFQINTPDGTHFQLKISVKTFRRCPGSMNASNLAEFFNDQSAFLPVPMRSPQHSLHLLQDSARQDHIEMLRDKIAQGRYSHLHMKRVQERATVDNARLHGQL